jgi:hypothetical protein
MKLIITLALLLDHIHSTWALNAEDDLMGTSSRRMQVTQGSDRLRLFDSEAQLRLDELGDQLLRPHLPLVEHLFWGQHLRYQEWLLIKFRTHREICNNCKMGLFYLIPDHSVQQ